MAQGLWRAGIALVPDVDGVAFLTDGTCYVCVGSYVFGSIAACEIVQHQHRIGGVDGFPGAGNADLLHLVGAVTQTGGVDHVQRHALDLYGLLHLVAGGARNGGDDGQLGPSQCVEQRAFARVGLACNHHPDAFAQQGSLTGALANLGQCGLQFL